MPSEPPELYTVAFIGGTGPEGRGLAMRFGALGHSVVVGSRSQQRAFEAAEQIRAMSPGARASGAGNEAAAASAEIIVLTLPFTAVDDTLPPLTQAAQGKIVISAIAPVDFVDGRPVARGVDAGSAAQH